MFLLGPRTLLLTSPQQNSTIVPIHVMCRVKLREDFFVVGSPGLIAVRTFQFDEVPR